MGVTERERCGSSTALDTVVFVLLVGVAVVVLAGVNGGGPAGGDRVAEETADVLATSTTAVSYSQSLTVENAAVLGVDGERTVAVERTASGSYAELLAGAVTATPTVAGRSLVPSGGRLRRRVHDVTRAVLPTREARIQVRAVWRPYVGASGDSLVVGPRPPGDGDVSVATLSVPSGFPNVSAAARRGARTDGYQGVASAIARGVVDGVFPPAATRTALYSEGPDAGIVAAGYDHSAAVLDVDLGSLLERRAVAAANGKLADALAAPLRRELARVFNTPQAAARAVRVDRVRVVVRTWSP